MYHIFFIKSISTLKTSAVLQQQVENLESDLEAMKSAENLHNEEKTSWNKLRQALENDLDSAETLLDKIKRPACASY